MSSRNYFQEAKQLQELFDQKYDEAALIEVLKESRSLEDAYERILSKPSIVEWNFKGSKNSQQFTSNSPTPQAQTTNYQKSQQTSQIKRGNSHEYRGGHDNRGRGRRNYGEGRYNNSSDNYQNSRQNRTRPNQEPQVQPIKEKVPSAWSKLTLDKTEEQVKGNIKQTTEVKEVITVKYEPENQLNNQSVAKETPQQIETEKIFYPPREEPEPETKEVEDEIIEVVNNEVQPQEEPPIQPQEEEKEQQFTFMPSKSTIPQFQPQQTYQQQQPPQAPQYQQMYEQTNRQPQNQIEAEAPAAPVFVSNQAPHAQCLLTLPKSLQPFANTSDYQAPYYQPTEMQMRQAQPHYAYMQQYAYNSPYLNQQFQQPRANSQAIIPPSQQPNYQQFPTGIAAPPGF